MIELSESVPVNLICVLALAALGLRRVVLMDRLHWPRVVILTVLLWVPTVYLILFCCSLLSPLYQDSCMTASEEPRVFCISE